MSKDAVASDWIQLYDLCQATVADAQTELNEKDRLAKTGGNTAKLSRSVRQKTEQIQGDIGNLTQTLAEMERRPSDYRIGEGEVNRRRGLLAQLKNAFDRVQKNAAPGGEAKRAGLYGDDSEQRRSNRAPAAETDRTRDLSNEQMIQEQQFMLQAQDRHLDDILTGVTRLKGIGQDIHEELDLQSNLLNEIDTGVDKTTRGLKTQTKKAEQLIVESGGCCGLCVIFFLVGIIVLLVATNYACYVFNKDKC